MYAWARNQKRTVLYRSIHCYIYITYIVDAMTITLSPGVNNAEILNSMIKADVCFRSSVIIPTTTFGGMLSGGCHVRYILCLQDRNNINV